jgi:hypothetical protein
MHKHPQSAERRAFSSMGRSSTLPQFTYQFAPEERPVFPGAPYSPRHTPAHRALYALSALVMAMASGFSNGLVTTNIVSISGELGLYLDEASLLLAVYIAFNATGNLMLVKSRVQFGIPATMNVALGAVLVAQVIEMLWPSLGTQLMARAVSGIAGSGLTTLTFYTTFQVFPLRLRPMALALGASLPQLAIPVARLFPVELIAMDHWAGLHLVEVAMALSAWTMLTIMPLPPTVGAKAFEPLDAVTVALTISAMLLICTVLAVGRYHWWTDTPWLGEALAAALPLLALAFFIEDRRRRPLLWVRWYAKSDILLFTLIAVVMRVALTEQTYSAVGLLTLGGLTSDQLHTLFLFVLLAMIAGITLATIISQPEHLHEMMLVAALVIALGAWLDTNSTSATRPQQLYLSQALLGFGTMLFLSPALLLGLARMRERGPTYLVSFVVLFSTTQNVGSLAGSALLGSIQTARARLHAQNLAEDLSLGDPLVIARLQHEAQRIAPSVIDPFGRSEQARSLLGQALQNQANVLAYNDTFWVVMWIALAAALLLFAIILHERCRSLGRFLLQVRR